jgi:hypothetical protein
MDEAEAIVRLLEAGVPPSIVANVYSWPLDDIKSVVTELRVHNYGTSELDEGISFIAWKSYGVILDALSSGRPVDRQKMAMMILGKSIAVAGRRPPEEFAAARDKLIAMAAQLTPATEVPAPGEFTLLHGDGS